MINSSQDDLPFPEFASSIPPEERAKLAGLTVGEIHAMTLARVDEYRKITAALLALHNSITPIHQLPIETMSHIFSMSWSGRSSLKLMLVCRHWRAVILATSRFWADAVADEDWALPEEQYKGVIKHFHTVLERSSPRLLRLRLDHCDLDFRWTLGSYFHRLVSLRARVGETGELHGLMDAVSNMSGLVKLSVDLVEFSSIDASRYEPFADNALPRLRSLFAPAPLFKLLVVPALLELRLYWTHHRGVWPGFHAYEDFLDVLKKCTTLRLLALQDVFPVDVPGESPAASAVPDIVELSALRLLDIEDDAKCISRVLAHLSFPSHARVTLEMNERRWHSTDFGVLRASLPPRLGCFPPLVSVNTISIRVHTDVSRRTFFVIECSAGTKVHLRVNVYHPIFAVQDLVDIFNACTPSSIHTLALHDANLEGVKVDFALLFKGFPSVKRIDAGPHCFNLVLDALRTVIAPEPESSQAGNSSAVCPRLEELRVYSNHSPSELSNEKYRALPNEERIRIWTSVVEPVLAHRAALGSRLQRLRFGEKAADKSKGAQALSEGVEQSSEPLRKLVDGAVLFESCAE